MSDKARAVGGGRRGAVGGRGRGGGGGGGVSERERDLDNFQACRPAMYVSRSAHARFIASAMVCVCVCVCV
jgi:hypothetical protein